MGEGARGPVILLAGPTASGKSRLAIDLARYCGGVIVNADSLQVYRELRVVTARPTADDEAAAPHRLYGVMSAAQACSAGRWRALALAEIDAIWRRGAVPILVGGSGLYFRALVEGLAGVPDIPPELRARGRRLYGELGAAAFKAMLGMRDPAAARRLQDSDRQRLIRAWEVVEATGRPLADWQTDSPGAPLAAPSFTVLVMPDRERLYAACDRRFDAMLANGALDEVAALDALGLDSELPAMKALGVPALRRHLHGELSFEAARLAGRQATRHYAKRQVTWFRHQMAADLTLAGDGAPGPALAAAIARFLLTVA